MNPSSNKPAQQTLKGIFSEPKIVYRRNFLNENKLSLKELQKTTAQKLSTGKKDSLSKFQRVKKPEQLTIKRSNSQIPLTDNTKTKNGDIYLKKRTNSQIQLGSRCPSCSSSNKSNDLCDKQIQTEDIQDEVFLYDALKKCSSNTNTQIASNGNGYDDQSLNTIYRNSKDMDTTSFKSNRNERDLPSSRLNDNNQHDPNRNQYLDDGHNNDMQPPGTARSYASQQSQVSFNTQANALDERAHYQQQQNEINEKFDNLSIDKHQRYEGGAEKQHNGLSDYTGYAGGGDADNGDRNGGTCGTARSRISDTGSRRSMMSQQSAYSLNKKRSNPSLHKLGSRDDVRLPRYLEREKREQEEKRLRELEEDRSCPPGHYMLSDSERTHALQAAQQKFQSLVDELNRMPMTAETLRIRKRKAEIEKELVVIEADIRVFSKPKVYVIKE